MNFIRHYEDLIEQTLVDLGRPEVRFVVKPPSREPNRNGQGYIMSPAVGDLGVIFWVHFEDVGLEGKAVIACFPEWSHLDTHDDNTIVEDVTKAVDAIDAQTQSRKDLLEHHVPTNIVG